MMGKIIEFLKRYVIGFILGILVVNGLGTIK